MLAHYHLIILQLTEATMKECEEVRESEHTLVGNEILRNQWDVLRRANRKIYGVVQYWSRLTSKLDYKWIKSIVEIIQAN